MSYIGNTPISIAFLTDTFSGNGSTTAFTMTVAPANTSSIIVAITGVLQDPSTYSVSGTTLTFSGAPPSGTSNISVRYLGIPASGVTTTAYRTVTNFTATAGQTSFSVPSYTVGYIDVYRNGVRLVSTDFTATTGTTVVLNNGCTVGDAVVTESFYVSSVLNAIPATAGAVNSTYLTDGAVTQAKLGTGVAGNGPAFSAYPSAGVSATSSTWVKIPFNTEDFDTNSNYDNATNYRFTPTVAGYYQVNYLITMPNVATGNYIASALYRNGVIFKLGTILGSTSGITCSTHNSLVLYLNGSTDFIEVYGFQGTGSTQTIAVASNATGASTIQVSNYFNAAMIRAA